VRDLLRALGRQFIEPIDELGIAATLINETFQAVTTIAPARATTHAQCIELAEEIAECDCAVAGHGLFKCKFATGIATGLAKTGRD